MLSTVAALLWAASATAGDETIPGNPLVDIAAGPFVFGSDAGKANERPRRVVEGKAFAMNEIEITNAQYQRFVDATGHRAPFYRGHPSLGLPDHPVVGVSFSDAEAFCAYHGLRLPSEQEFERAARGTDGALFPWGNLPVDATRASGGGSICCRADNSDGYAMTAPARSFPKGASKEHLLNLVGNVWEWTRDFYAHSSGGTPRDIVGRYRVLRGGAWNSDPSRLSTTYRLAYDSEFRFAANGGFRCVLSQD